MPNRKRGGAQGTSLVRPLSAHSSPPAQWHGRHASVANLKWQADLYFGGGGPSGPRLFRPQKARTSTEMSWEPGKHFPNGRNGSGTCTNTGHLPTPWPSRPFSLPIFPCWFFFPIGRLSGPYLLTLTEHTLSTSSWLLVCLGFHTSAHRGRI